MISNSDSITSAMRVNIRTGERTRIDAADIEKADNKHFHYFCTDCYDKGLHVRLKFVKPSERDFHFQQLDRFTGEVKENARTKDKTINFPAHFDRWPGAKDHRCDQIVRYAALRSEALLLNAAQTGSHSFIFPVGLPGEGWNNHDGKVPVDLRSIFRPVGMEMGGIKSAKEFGRLLSHFERDPGLQHFQHFHDGYDVRKFDEVFFETPSAMHSYLNKEGAVGRSHAMVVAYVLNPNTTAYITKDVPKRDGFPDLSMPKLEDGSKLKLIVQGMNKGAVKALSDAARPDESKWFEGSPVLVLGEARIDRDDKNIVRVEIYNEVQVMPWDNTFKFLPKHTPKIAAKRGNQIALEL